MSYTLLLEKAAEKELRNLPAPILRRIDKRLMALYDEPRPRGVVKLKGKEGEGWRVKAEVLFGMVEIANGTTEIATSTACSRNNRGGGVPHPDTLRSAQGDSKS